MISEFVQIKRNRLRFVIQNFKFHAARMDDNHQLNENRFYGGMKLKVLNNKSKSISFNLNKL